MTTTIDLTRSSRLFPSIISDNSLDLNDEPLGFAANDTNLRRYVGNHPTLATDPDGLAEYSPWQWNWHHLLPQELFDAEFKKKHGLKINIDSAEYGWMLRAGDHSDIHPGWNRAWKEWIRDQERLGRKITKDMIDKKLKEMIGDFCLDNLGFAAKYG